MTIKEQTAALLDGVVANVVEDMLFDEAVPVATGPLPTGAELLWSSVASQGADPIRLTIAILLPDAEQLMESLGTGEGEAALDDLIAELANTLAGLLAAAIDEGADVRLGLPTTGRGVRWTDAAPGRTRTYETTEHRFSISLESQSSAPPAGSMIDLPTPSIATSAAS